MKVSEAISKLQAIVAEFGDMEIVALDLVEEMSAFSVEFDLDIDVIGLPTETGGETQVCAVAPPFLLEPTDDDDDPAPKSKLTFVK